MKPKLKSALCIALSTLMLVGCRQSETPNVGTTAEVQMPETDPPVITKALAERMQPGLAQADALSILQDAARQLPSVKSYTDFIVVSGNLNPIRYDLTVRQGNRKLILAFKDGKLAAAQQDGLE
jgi:hypothetical protein